MRIILLISISFVFLQNLIAQENRSSEYIVLKNGKKTYGETKIKYASSSQPYIQFRDSIKYNIEQISIFKTKLNAYAIVNEDGLFSGEKIAQKISNGKISIYWIYNPKDLHTYKEDEIKYQYNNFFSSDSNAFYQVNYSNLNNYFLREYNQELKELSSYKINNIISKSLYISSFVALGYGASRFFKKTDASPIYLYAPISYAFFKLGDIFAKKNTLKAIDAIYDFNSK